MAGEGATPDDPVSTGPVPQKITPEMEAALAAAFANFQKGLFLPSTTSPNPNQVGMFGFEGTPYDDLGAQIQDTFINSGLTGTRNNPQLGNKSPRYQFASFPANVGGGDWGKSAYAPGNFNPYAGRGNGVFGTPTTPPGGGGPTPPPPGGGPGIIPPPNVPPPTGIHDPRVPPGTPPPVQPPLPPPGSGGGWFGPNPPTPNPNPVQPVIPPGNGGHFGTNPPPPGGGTTPPPPNPTNPPPGPPVGVNPVYPPFNPGNEPTPNPGAGTNTDTAKMVDYFMKLPDSQKGDYFNAISQYGLLQGVSGLGSALDQALRMKMGSDQFKNWLTTMDTKQGSTIKSTEGLPDWLIKGLGG